MKQNAAEKPGLTDRWRDLGLTGRQVQFLLEYLQNGRNATKAALAAGYSPRSVAELGCRALRNVKVRRARAVGVQSWLERDGRATARPSAPRGAGPGAHGRRLTKYRLFLLGNAA